VRFAGDYSHEFVGLPTSVAALAFIVLVAIINFRGIVDSLRVNAVLEVVRSGSGIPTRTFSAIALLAIANGALLNMIMASRLLYRIGRERVMPQPFGRGHPVRRTPWVAIVFVTSVAMLVIRGAVREARNRRGSHRRSSCSPCSAWLPSGLPEALPSRGKVDR
jgi:amino acid transporter